MDLHKVVLAGPASQLAHRLYEGRALNVAHRAAELHDTHVRRLVGVIHGNLRDALDPVLDGIRQVRDDLHGAAEVVAATLALDDVVVDLAGGDVVLARQGDVEVALVVSEVEVDLTAVVEDKDLAVPVRAALISAVLFSRLGSN